MSLTRDDLEAGRLQEAIARSKAAASFLSEAELQASLCHTLQQQQPDSDVWVFAYGSLIWNPIFRYVERRVGTIYGFHRRFCLWVPVGRGTPDNPGLVLGLDRGGSCRGIAFRIAASAGLATRNDCWFLYSSLGQSRRWWARISSNHLRD
jgi:glutathione-specific gamma-glutamylcyclotransferase